MKNVKIFSVFRRGKEGSAIALPSPSTSKSLSEPCPMTPSHITEKSYPRTFEGLEQRTIDDLSTLRDQAEELARQRLIDPNFHLQEVDPRREGVLEMLATTKKR